MKKKLLALSVALAVGGVAGTASAAVVTTYGGIGHNLVLPYYTTENGQMTLVNIVNTDLFNAKAVKVRFRGAVDSDDVFDFQVFLSPGDVWSANVSPSASGGSMLTTTDRSCTLPIGVGTVNTPVNDLEDFKSGRLSSTDPVGLKEGYVEIFNMADIPQYLGQYTGNTNNSWKRNASAPNPLFTTVKHVPVNNLMTPPCDPAILNSLESGITSGGNLIPPTYKTDAAAVATYQSLAVTNAYAAYTGTIGSTQPAGNYASPADPIATDGNGVVRALTAGGQPAFYFPGPAGASTATIANQGTGAVGALPAAAVYGEQAPYFAAPTPTLFGNWMIISPKNGSAHGGAMTSMVSTGPTRIVYSGQLANALTAQNVATDFPSLASTADAVLLQGFVSTAHYDFPDVSTPYEFADYAATFRAAAVSSALLQNTVTNEFLTNSVIAASTDYVFSMPTRRYHVAGRVGLAGVYEANTADKTNFAQIGSSTKAAYLPSRPFVDVVGGATTSFVTYDAKGHRSCVQTGSYRYFDQEETTPGSTSTVVISPGTPNTTAQVYLCNEAGVVSINNGGTAGKMTGALYSLYTGVQAGPALIGAVDITLDTPYRVAGWLSWNLAATNNTWGLPVIGQVFENAAVPVPVTVNGVAASYVAGFGVNTAARFTANAANTSFAGGTGIPFTGLLTGFTGDTAADWATDIQVQP